MGMRSALILALVSVVAGPAFSARAEPSYSRYIVVLRPGTDTSRAESEHSKREGVQVEHTYRYALNGYAARVPKDRVDDLRSESDVAFVQPDVVYHVASQTTPTGVSRIHAVSSTVKGTGVNVAVIDTGIDLNNPDLASNIMGGVNCSNGSNPDDFNGHGTHVAGTIAAIDNGIGVRGVAPEAKLWSVRVLNNNGVGGATQVLCGLDFVDSKSPAKGGPIKVANMSLEIPFNQPADDGQCGSVNNDAVHQAICQLVDDRVTVVAAAGNDHDDIKFISPAAYDEVIAVSALADSDGAPCGTGAATGFGADDTFASFSNFATSAADKAHLIAAPGVGILSTKNNGTTEVMSGTSMATPHVSGAAALYLQSQPAATPDAVKQALFAAAEPVDVNVNGECTDPAVSHTDPAGNNPEPVASIGQWVLPLDAVTPGVVRGNKWFLNDGFDAVPEHVFNFGSATDTFVAGDWDGDGAASPGVVRGNNWFLVDGFGTGTLHTFAYGSSTDTPVVGDWDHTGSAGPGVVRGNYWFLRDGFSGPTSHNFPYGKVGDIPVVGDWNRDGSVTPGVVRGNVWYLSVGFTGHADHVVAFGKVGDHFIAGDWDGNGTTTPGVVRGNVWYLSNDFSGAASAIFPYGIAGDHFIAGDWNGVTPPPSP
jgi:subtilisin family serine protease